MNVQLMTCRVLAFEKLNTRFSLGVMNFRYNDTYKAALTTNPPTPRISYFSKIHFIIIPSTLRSSKWSVSSGFPAKILYVFSFPPLLILIITFNSSVYVIHATQSI